MEPSRSLPCAAVLGTNVALLLTVLTFSQTPPPDPPAHATKPAGPGPKGNFVLNLSPPADKRSGPEIAVILALFAPDQSRDPAEIQTAFGLTTAGQPQKDGRYLLNYYLACAGDAASTGLLLSPGEPVQMIKSDDPYLNLRLERHDTPR